MSRQPTDLDAMKITIAEDGTATLTGINYDDLRSLLTAASLYRGNDTFKAEVPQGDLACVTHENNIESLKWHLHQRLLLDVLEGRMAGAISPQYGAAEQQVRSAKAMYEHRIARIEDTVRDAEAKAAGRAEVVDSLVEISATLAKALRDADGAVAKLNRIRNRA